ncbi:MAG: cytochrome c3 family protein [Gammaproteobacteria bacterium]
MLDTIGRGNVGSKSLFLQLVMILATMLSVSGALAAETTQPMAESFWSRGQHFQTEGEVLPIPEDGIHDPTNETVNVLQEPYESMANFPRDAAGIIDWVQVLEQGLIDPRVSVSGEGDMFPVDFDIIFKNTRSMPYVRFPHKPHTEWLTCANCHPLIFIPQKGANPVTMSDIIQGKYCGVCHGKVAFPPTMHCGRCHSVPKETNLLR